MKKFNKEEDPTWTAGRNLSCWVRGNEEIRTSGKLNENLHTDVVIVGGGLAGVSVAYCLAKAGKRIVLVEDGAIGSGETGRTTAQLVTALDNRYYELEKLFGKENTKLIADSHKAAIDFVEETVRNESIDCSFERLPGYLFRHPSDKEDSLDKELEAATRAGLSVQKLDSVPGINGNEGACIQFDGQAQFHPLQYLAGLCKAIQAMGGEIYTNTHASEFTAAGILTADGFGVKADHVVIATNSPVNNKYALHSVQYAYRSYVIGALVKKYSVKKAIWWDTGNFDVNDTIPPYHYIRLQAYNDEYDLLISGGEDHATGNTEADGISEENRYALLEGWTKERFPIEKVMYKWSGQVMEPMDGIAYIGRNPYDADNVYIVTGDSGNGMTHCTIAGLLITDLILGNENKWEKIYRPSRTTLKASGVFFKEYLGGFLSYLKQTPNHEQSGTLASLKKCEGKIVTLQDKQCGAYRDEHGYLHIVSAECTHLQCVVQWNNDERSWDCPCHGSRFTYDGKVINGPANIDLLAYHEELAKQAKG